MPSLVTEEMRALLRRAELRGTFSRPDDLADTAQEFDAFVARLLALAERNLLKVETQQEDTLASAMYRSASVRLTLVGRAAIGSAPLNNWRSQPGR